MLLIQIGHQTPRVSVWIATDTELDVEKGDERRGKKERKTESSEGGKVRSEGREMEGKEWKQT